MSDHRIHPGRFKGAVAVVTGGAHGIGRAISHRLAAEGLRLAVCDKDKDALERVRLELGAACLLARVVDVGEREDMARFASDVHGHVPAANVLINNAGVGLVGDLNEVTLDDWRWLLSTNLWGAIHGCHFFVPPMIQARRGGHVVHMASVLGYMGVPGAAPYATSKAALLGLSESLGAELAPHRIHVSAVCPGLVATGLLDRGRVRSADDGLVARLRSRYAAQGQPPEQVAEAVWGALLRPRPVVHVSFETKGLDLLQRWWPEASRELGRRARWFQKG